MNQSNKTTDMYYAIRNAARAAKTSHMHHHCERYEHAMSEWHYGERAYKYEVQVFIEEEWDTVFSSESKPECEAYMRSCNLLNDIRLQENGVCAVCDMYDKRKATVSEGKQPYFLIIATGKSRHYLGPWEGGTWGDDTEVLEVRRAFTFEQGLKHARELREAYPQSRYDRFSSANKGEPDVSIRCVYSELDPRMPQDERASRTYE